MLSMNLRLGKKLRRPLRGFLSVHRAAVRRNDAEAYADHAARVMCAPILALHGSRLLISGALAPGPSNAGIMMSPIVTLQQLAHALGGEVTGGQVVAPGPGHGRRDRSLAVRASARAPNGFVVHAFAPGDDWRKCRDYVAERLGMRTGAEFVDAQIRSVPSPADRIERAQSLWYEAVDPRRTLVERYLASRNLRIPDDAAVAALRFHPRCPWRDEQIGLTIRVPAMVAAMRSLETHQITAVHRTRLTDDGRKVDRRMLGVAGGAAIILENLTGPELAIGEGIETCLAGAEFGFRPVWAVASAGALGAFPVLKGVEKLTILGERDNASETAVMACHGKWTAAGRHVVVAMPKVGKDMNDAWSAANVQ